MKQIITTLVFALTLGGCSRVANLRTEVDKLSQQKENLCAIVLEKVTDNRVLYVGDFTFYDRVTGQKFVVRDMIYGCEDMLETFQEVLKERKEQFTGTPLPRSTVPEKPL